MEDKLKGGLYGLLIGDAVGVPYEFKSSLKIPAHDQIDMFPPKDYHRTWDDVPLGTWSDDGALSLCLLSCFVYGTKPELDCTVLGQKFVMWLGEGYMSVDNFTFDVDNQTLRALTAFKQGKPASGRNDSSTCGNGSLMRTLPVALWLYEESDQIVIAVAESQSFVTHPHKKAQICCAMQALLAKYLLKGLSKDDAINAMIVAAIAEYDQDPEFLDIMKAENNEPMGSGYVVDSLWSALYAFRVGKNYEDVIRTAIKLGEDTDTTACIAGGLAGIYYGYSGIPQRWIDGLRGREILDPLCTAFLQKMVP